MYSPHLAMLIAQVVMRGGAESINKSDDKGHKVGHEDQEVLDEEGGVSRVGGLSGDHGARTAPGTPEDPWKQPLLPPQHEQGRLSKPIC